MRKIIKKFNEIWESADAHNRGFRQNRFIKIFEQKQRFMTVGIYDSRTKKYCLFDTINLTGNFRYNNADIPAELNEMEQMVSQAKR
jgi:hypothetical protein